MLIYHELVNNSRFMLVFLVNSFQYPFNGVYSSAAAIETYRDNND